jgi:hypothetical protein
MGCSCVCVCVCVLGGEENTWWKFPFIIHFLSNQVWGRKRETTWIWCLFYCMFHQDNASYLDISHFSNARCSFISANSSVILDMLIKLCNINISYSQMPVKISIISNTYFPVEFLNPLVNFPFRSLFFGSFYQWSTCIKRVTVLSLLKTQWQTNYKQANHVGTRTSILFWTLVWKGTIILTVMQNEPPSYLKELTSCEIWSCFEV